jgi:integrase
MPTHEDMVSLVHSVHDYWNVEKNPGIRYEDPLKRVFNRDRNYAVIIGLLNSACRIGEMLSLKVDDYDRVGKQITIGESTGRKSHTVPVSSGFNVTFAPWLRVR